MAIYGVVVSVWHLQYSLPPGTVFTAIEVDTIETLLLNFMKYFMNLVYAEAALINCSYIYIFIMYVVRQYRGVCVCVCEHKSEYFVCAWCCCNDVWILCAL